MRVTYTRESSVENHLRKRVEELGGTCVKQTWPGRRGAPDRLCLFPGKSFMVETKPPKGHEMAAWQGRAVALLRDSGVRVYIAYTKEQVDEVLEIETRAA